MLSSSLPPARSYPPVIPIRFKASPCGWRTLEELAEFLGLSRIGFIHYQRFGGRRLYGPRYARKTTSAVPKGAYSDAEVSKWILNSSLTEQSWLAYHQHTYPSDAAKAEAKASKDSLIEAYRLLKQ